MKPFKIKTGDTLPPLRLLLQELNEAGRVVGVADLANAASVAFNMKDAMGNLVIDHGDVEILDDTTGDVQYNWEVVDTLTPGKYRGEFEVTFTDGGIKTYPNDQEIPIVMRAALG